MTRSRFDDLLLRAVVVTGAATLAVPLIQLGSPAVIVTYVATFIAGGLTVIVVAAASLAVLVRRYGKQFDRDQVALAEAQQPRDGHQFKEFNHQRFNSRQG